MATFTVIVRPGYTFPEAVVVDLAALRAAALPTIELQGTLDTATIGDGAITEPKIAAGAVTNTKLGARSVTTDKIALATILGENIADETISEDKLILPLSGDALPIFDGTTPGIVQLPGGNGTSLFLRGDGQWASPDFNAAVQILMAQNYI